jgi:hypothetical protein
VQLFFRPRDFYGLDFDVGDFRKIEPIQGVGAVTMGHANVRHTCRMDNISYEE